MKKQTYQYPCQFIDLWLEKCWSWRYIQKANMFDMVKLKVKLKYLFYWSEKIKLIQILIHIYGNLLIINGQNADHEYIFKNLLCLTEWKGKWKVSENEVKIECEK